MISLAPSNESQQIDTKVIDVAAEHAKFVDRICSLSRAAGQRVHFVVQKSVVRRK